MLNIVLAYCGYSPTSPFFLLFSEHKHCDKAAIIWNSENARSKMEGSLRGSVGTGTMEDESSTGRVWAAGFHYVTARSRLARVSKRMHSLFLYLPVFFFGPRPTAATVVHLYCNGVTYDLGLTSYNKCGTRL